MMRREISDETLMAYADGELDAATAAGLEAALAEDAALARRLALFTGTREALGALARSGREAPVPDALAARVRATLDAARKGQDAARVVPFRRPAATLARDYVRPAALAAGLAAAAFLAGYSLAPSGDPQGGALRFAVLETPGVQEALGSAPSGARLGLPQGQIALIASFRDAAGAFCREFEIDLPDATTAVSVACRTRTGWEPNFAVVSAGADPTGYAPASSLETLDAYLAAIGAGAPMSAEDEAAALASAGG